MKVIEYNTTNQIGFDAVSYAIHNALLSANITYNADAYALFSTAPKSQDETKVYLVIDEDAERYPVIIGALTTEQQNSIITL